MELTTDTTIALLVAARLGSTRLIDNMLVTLK
jgi:pantothenate synthetase